MKILLEVDNKLTEDEIIIKCKEIDDRIINIQKAINNIDTDNTIITFFKNDKEYYLSVSNILFFETDGNIIYGHTENDTYRVKYRLHELNNILPSNFMRISKSTIVNINLIISISYNITSSNFNIVINRYMHQEYILRN